MKSVVIYGGTFNPIHNGHVKVCEHVLSLGHEIILMPNSVPPHKSNGNVASGEDRFNMCKLAVEGFENIIVSDWELRKGGQSFTVDTTRYFKEMYPQDKLSILIGTDMFLTFEQWREWENIGKMAELLVVARSSDDHKELKKHKKVLKESGIDVTILENTVYEISSTAVRNCLVKEKCCVDIPTQVESYILQNKVFPSHYMAEDLRCVVEPLMDNKRYVHTLGVEEQARNLARIYGLDENICAVAGVLHDVCKRMDNDFMAKLIVNSSDSSMFPSYDELMTQTNLLHAYAGSIYIKEYLGITDIDIINAIRYHTTGRGDMSMLEKIIYLADYTSKERDFDGVEEMRRLTETDLDDAMGMGLSMVMESLKERGYKICKDSQDAFNQYTKC